MIRTHMESTIDQKMAVVHGTLCTILHRNSNGNQLFEMKPLFVLLLWWWFFLRPSAPCSNCKNKQRCDAREVH